MSHRVCLAACAVACTLMSLPAWADGAGDGSAKACSAKLNGRYGFHCHGFAHNGIGFGPVTFVGTVEGRDHNTFFEGRGTLNSSAGSVLTHFAGPATYGANCFGQVDYTTFEIILPDGTVVAPLPPASFQFIGVDGGNEILGTGVAPPGVTGDFVPRLTCRLVRAR